MMSPVITDHIVSFSYHSIARAVLSKHKVAPGTYIQHGPVANMLKIAVTPGATGIPCEWWEIGMRLVYQYSCTDSQCSLIYAIVVVHQGRLPVWLQSR